MEKPEKMDKETLMLMLLDQTTFKAIKMVMLMPMEKETGKDKDNCEFKFI